MTGVHEKGHIRKFDQLFHEDRATLLIRYVMIAELPQTVADGIDSAGFQIIEA
ncbi:MAG: hypothetical protein IH969_01000 [Candidatus Krumholzibacteriota bacterium]|nr:hypothetical protein [Candidatus Krumholzibacteriota bacterium]